MKKSTYRIFHAVQYEINPRTLESLGFSKDNIISCINHKTITRYAYICHDKDKVTLEDIEAENSIYTKNDLGKEKGRHWHIVIETARNDYPISTIASWLGIPENMISTPKGHGAFLENVFYLTHSDDKSKAMGKYEYPSSAVYSNFNWQAEVESMVLRKTKYERPLTLKEYIKNAVLYEGMSIGEIIERYPTLYREEMTVIQKLRQEYINRTAPLPPFRVNYYIYGNTGCGKDTMAHTLAKMLFPDAKYDDDIYFEVGSRKVSFSGYDGQPVIIWSEFRADTFLKVLDGYEGVLSTLDIIPKNKREHKKYGDIRLINSINIVTSTQDFEEFLQDLIPKNDPDPGQAPRRFPIVIPIHADYFEILINNGYRGCKGFSEYTAWKTVTGSFGKLARKLNARPDLFQRTTKVLGRNILDAHEEVLHNLLDDPYKGKSDEEVIQLIMDEKQT